ncbi:646_t:CDS:1, partial [Gigaspora margarita]
MTIEENIRNQEQQNRQFIDQLRSENERMLKKVREENKSGLDRMQRELDENTQKQSEFWQMTKKLA